MVAAALLAMATVFLAPSTSIAFNWAVTILRQISTSPVICSAAHAAVSSVLRACRVARLRLKLGYLQVGRGSQPDEGIDWNAIAFLHKGESLRRGLGSCDVASPEMGGNDCTANLPSVVRIVDLLKCRLGPLCPRL